MVGEEKRHQMIQNLFGEQSEEEEEVESEHESNRQPDSASDEGDGGPEPEGEDEAEVEGQGEAELESEGEPQNLHHPVHAESEDERDQSSQEIEIGDQREETEERYSESDEKEDYDQNNVTSRRREIVDSGSERSEDNLYAANVESKVSQARSPSRSSGDEKDEDQFLQSAPEIRDVFGDSDEEEAEYEVQNQVEDRNRSPMEDDEEQHEKELRPEDMIPDDDAPYYSEEEHIEAKSKEKPTGPPLELEIPLCNPPAEPNKMHMIKVSNIMGIDPKPFDPRTYVEEDYYVTDESGSKKRLRLENNVVRWRKVKNPDGTTSVESNARFVEWSDGSLQLQIGNEVLNISKQDAQHEQSHLFMRHGKGILQSQGRILTKMRFMPSSLSSDSHRLLTALVDSRHKKVYRIKNCITNIDPEKEKEQKEKAASQSIRTSEHLSRKKQKVSRKYTQTTIRRERQLSPGFLEDDPYEEDDADYQDSRRSAVRRRFDQDMEQEARAEKRIINAKKATNKSAYPAAKPYRRPVEFSESEKEESEYETDGEEEEASPYRRNEEPDRYADDDEQGEEEEPYDESEEEVQEPKQKIRTSGGSVKRKDMESDEDSPPRKTTTHRRMKMVYESDEE